VAVGESAATAVVVGESVAAESLILSHCDGGGGRGVGRNGSQPQGVGHGTFSGHGNGCGSEVSQCQGWLVAPEPTDVD
jgi:hypothetical protein